MSVTYPDDTMVVLGRNFDPAIDIGPAISRKVLKENGQVVYKKSLDLISRAASSFMM